ncbi:MAG TPA: hypothetical protein VMV77_21780, partial [Bacteroidales bacterium]|nr:hypothetical protein [Bacteroidales bacterium]
TNITPGGAPWNEHVLDYCINFYGNKMWLISTDNTAIPGQPYKSVDQGLTWKQYYGGAQKEWRRIRCDSAGRNVYSIYITIDDIILVKSVDGESGWISIDSIPRVLTPPIELAVNGDGSVIYHIGSTNKIRVSRDYGDTFTQYNLPATFAVADIMRSLRCNSLGNIAYLQDRTLKKFYRSSDYGQTWVDISYHHPTLGPAYNGYSIDASGVIVYVLKLDVIGGNIQRLLVSKNAGDTWINLATFTVGGTIVDSDIECTPDGSKGLFAIDNGSINGYYFTSAGGVSARTMHGLHIQLQQTLANIEREKFYLRNNISGFDMRVETGNKHVDKIRLLYRYANTTTWRVLDELDKGLLSIADNTTYDYTFDKSAFNRILSENTSGKLYDNVPHRANAMALINNQLVFGGYRDGYSLDITPDFTVTEQRPAGRTGLSLKTGTTQKYVLVYYDEYNRSSAPLVDPVGSIITFSRAYDPTNPRRAARITIEHLPPTWAVKYKVLRARPIIDYRFITDLTYTKAVNDKLYIFIGATEGEYAIGDKLEAVSFKSGVLVDEDLFVEVEDVVFKDAAFSNTDEGYWVVITPPATGVYSLGSVLNGSSAYPFTVFYLIKYDLDNPESIYLETSESFAITGGYHMGNTQSQTVAQDAILDLTDGDVFWAESPYHIEKFQVGESIPYNALGRGMLLSDNFKQINRYASLTFSDVFVPDTGFNGLSSFNLAMINYKDLNIGDGAIVLIDEEYTNLLVLQEDFVSKVLVNKDILQTASGEGLVSGSKLFLGQQIPYAGDYGCQDPAAFARWGNAKYFPDKKRGVILRLSQDGLTEISRYGFRDYFNDLFKTSGVLKGAYDPRHSEYILHDVDNALTIGFSEPENGFPTFFSYMPDYIVNGGDQMWSFKDEFLWKHNATDVYNNFYGVQYTSKIVFVFNEEPDIIKVIESISLHSDSAWVVNHIKDRFRLTDIPSANFENKEGFFFAAIPKAVGTARANIFTDNIATQGLGVGISMPTTTSVIIPKISAMQASVGDMLWYIEAGVPTLADDITVITDNGNGTTTITISSIPAHILNTKFLFVQKNSYLEGDSLRDYYFELELEHAGNKDTELFSVIAEVKQSKQ